MKVTRSPGTSDLASGVSRQAHPRSTLPHLDRCRGRRCWPVSSRARRARTVPVEPEEAEEARAQAQGDRCAARPAPSVPERAGDRQPRRCSRPAPRGRRPGRPPGLVAPVSVTPVAAPGPLLTTSSVHVPAAPSVARDGGAHIDGEVDRPRRRSRRRLSPARSPRTPPRRGPGRSAWPPRPPRRSRGGRRATARRRRRCAPAPWLRRRGRRGRRSPRCTSPGWASRCAATGRRAGRRSGSRRPRRSAPRCERWR